MREHKFSCLLCGQHIACDPKLAGTKITCPNCDGTVTVPKTFSETAEPAAGAPAPPSPPLLPEAKAAEGPTSILAIVSLACGLLVCVGWLPGILCGHLARAKMRKDPALKGNRLAVAGLALSYASLILLLAAVAGGLYFKTKGEKAYAQYEQDSGTNLASLFAAPAATNNDTSLEANLQTNNPLWTLDIHNAVYPDQIASGKIQGCDFTSGPCTFKNGELKITSEEDKNLYLVIRGLDGDVENRSYEFQLPQGGDVKVEEAWLENNQTRSQAFNSGYALKLEFGGIAKRKLSAKIYLCLPDGRESYLAGTLDIKVLKKKSTAQ